MPSSSSSPELSILIVSWNVSALLAECLTSIDAEIARASGALHVEIIVIDSASSDDTAETIPVQFPHIQFVSQSENVGYTRGNNIALAMARGRILFMLNPDTRILPGALTAMIAYLDSHLKVGIVGPRTLNANGTTQSTRRRFPTLWTGIFESNWLQRLAPPRILDRYYARDIADDATAEVDWVQGSALMARRAVYESIGGLDERYVMYSEELDWCHRAKAEGWCVVYLGGASIIHYGGKSSEQVGALTHIRFQQSKLRYFRMYHGTGAATLLRWVLLINYGLQFIIEGAKSALGHKRALRQERMHAYWQVLRSGLQVNS